MARRALAEAFRRKRQDELLALEHYLITLFRKRLAVIALFALQRFRLGHFRRFARFRSEFGPAALQIGRALPGFRLRGLQNGHRDYGIAVGQIDAAHPDRIAAGKDADIGNGKADALALAGGQQHGRIFRAGLHADNAVALVELHGDLAVAVDLDEVGQLVAPHRAACGGEHDVEVFPAFLVLRQRHDGGDPLVGLQRQQVDQRLAARLRRCQRQLPHLHLVDDAARGEEQDRRVRIGDEQPRDEILLLGRHARTALAAAPLCPVGVERHALDVAGMGNGDHHLLAGNQVLVLHVEIAFGDLRAARRCEFLAHGGEFVLDDGHHPDTGGQDVEIVGDFVAKLVQLVGNLVAAERRQPLQAQVENGTRLFLGEIIGAVVVEAVLGIVDQFDQRRHVLGFPAPFHQLRPRRCRVRRMADQLDHLVDIGNGDGETHQDMCPCPRLVEQELGAPRHHLLAEGNESAQQVEQVHLLRPAAVERDEVAAERGLQRREAVELVQHHIGDRITLQFDYHPVARAVGFVSDVGNAFEPLVAHQFGDLLDHRRLVDLKRYLRNDDRLTFAAQGFDFSLAAHDDRAAPGLVGGADARTAQNDATRGEIRSRNDLHHRGKIDCRVVDQRDTAID